MEDDGANDGDLTTGPLRKRVEDSRWKCRMLAFEELSTTLSQAQPEDKCYEEYSGLWKKIISDKNAAAQEVGVKALNAALEFGPPAVSQKVAAAVASTLVTECLKGRQKTVELASDALLMLCELECGAAVVEALVKEGFAHKVKKLVPIAVDCATAALKAFGPHDCPAQLLLKSLPDLYQNADAKVRDSAKLLAIELRRWLGAVMDKSIEALRPAQQKELKAAFDELPAGEKARATRLTRSKQKVAATQSAAGGGAGDAGAGAAQEEAAVDTFAMMEAQEVASKVPSSWMDDTNDKNWKVRSEALDKLIALCDVPRIKPGDFGNVVTMLKKLIAKDANVLVVAKAAQAVALLANGLRADFAPYAKSVAPVLLDKFKEKKASVLQQLHGAMDPITQYCVLMKESVELIDTALKSKVPNARVETLKWLVRAALAARPDDVVPALKGIAAALLEATNDATPEVRDLACNVLAALEIKLGERRMKPVLASLDKLKLAKVAEYVAKEKAGATASAPPAAAAPAAAAAAPATVAAPAKPAVATAPATAQTPAQKAPQSAPKSDTVSPVARAAPAPVKKRVWDDESAGAAGQDLVTDEVRALLGHENFKARVKGITTLAELGEERLRGLSYPLLFHLGQLREGWAREANFQVLQALFELVSRLAVMADFDANCVRIVAAPLIDKMGDFKLQKSATTCLDDLVWATSLDVVLHALYEPLEASKNAKALPNVLKWIQSSADEFGLAPAFAVADLVAYLAKSVLNNKQAAIKKAGVTLLGTVFKNCDETARAALKKSVAGAGLEGATVQQIDEQTALVASSTAPASYPRTCRMAGGTGPTGVAATPAAPVAAAEAGASDVVVPAVAAVAPVATPAPAIHVGPVLLRNDGKAARAKNAHHWKVSAASESDNKQQLANELLECASLELSRLMLSGTAADLIEAAAVLGRAVQSDWAAVGDSLDVVLKWITLRLYDRDSATLLAGLELMRSLIDALVARDARLDQYEASLFIPVLVDRLGLAVPRESAMVHEGILALTKVHPTSKLFAALLGGLAPTASINAAAKRQCMELVGVLIRRQGLTVASGVDAAAMVAQVAEHVTDREGPMRTTTGDTLAALEARMGHAELLAMVPQARKLDVVQVLTARNHATGAQQDAHTHATAHHPHRDHWNALRNGDEAAVVDAIKLLCGDLDALAAQKEAADGTVREIVARLWPSRPADGMRVRKYLVNGLLTLVSHRGCSLRVERASIDSVVASVLGELCATVAPAVAANADRQSFLKALNVMMFRLLENCRPQLTCAVLVTQLTGSIDAKAGADYVPSKFCDLAMKCLVKLSKSLSTIDPATTEGGMMGWEECIRAVDAFLSAHPPAAWKTRSNDVPLKAVKTTLSHLCKALGSELLLIIDATVKSTSTSVPIVRQYAELMLKKAAKDESDVAGAASIAASSDAHVAADTAATTTSTATSSSSSTRVVENADPNNTEYMARLLDLRRRFGLDSIGIAPAVAAPASGSDDTAAAEKKIEELRARMRAVRAPYEDNSAAAKALPSASASAPTSSWSSSTSSSLSSSSATTATTAPTGTLPSAASSQQSLAAIRERLAKLK